MTPRLALSEYTNVVFTDGFESGGLTNWDTSQGTGTTSAVAAAAHAGAFGARVATLETQYEYMAKGLSSSVADSVTTFWLRLGSGTKVVQVAQARDGSSSINMWQLAYDGSRHGFYFYPFSGTGSTEIFTGTLSQNGAFQHIFTTTTLGAVTVSITGLAPNSSQIVGLSLGVWTGTQCSTSPQTGGASNDTATVGSSITLNATAGGNLCARLYDVGFVTTPVLYTVTITHP